eukprot:SAG31_NODE_5317_length_2613_cov_3.123707_3_plen_94_part_00
MGYIISCTAASAAYSCHPSRFHRYIYKRRKTGKGGKELLQYDSMYEWLTCFIRRGQASGAAQWMGLFRALSEVMPAESYCCACCILLYHAGGS